MLMKLNLGVVKHVVNPRLHVVKGLLFQFLLALKRLKFNTPISYERPMPQISNFFGQIQRLNNKNEIFLGKIKIFEFKIKIQVYPVNKFLLKLR